MTVTHEPEDENSAVIDTERATVDRAAMEAALAAFLCAAGLPEAAAGDAPSKATEAWAEELLSGYRSDPLEIIGRIGLQLLVHSEPRAERPRDLTLTRRRPDQGEVAKIDPDRPGGGSLVEHDVEGEILHGGVHVLLHDNGQAVDLVDEEDVAGIQVGEDPGEILGPRQRGAGGGVDLRPHLPRDEIRKRGLPQPRQAGEEEVVERLAALLRRLDVDLQVVDEPMLPDEVGEGSRPKREVQPLVLRKTVSGKYRVALQWSLRIGEALR